MNSWVPFAFHLNYIDIFYKFSKDPHKKAEVMGDAVPMCVMWVELNLIKMEKIQKPDDENHSQKAIIKS